MPKANEYTGVLSQHMRAFINQKHTLGYDYREGARIIQKLDEMSIDFDCSTGLTKELVEAFTDKRAHWRQTTQESRIVTVKEFGRFLISQGIQAYIPDKSRLTDSNEYFAPYIFSKAEMALIFEKADNLAPRKNSIHHLIYPVLFRVLYGCGLRISEALALTVSDVDLQAGILRIRDSKNHKDRLVPMSEQLTKRCQSLAENIHRLSADDTPFFCKKNKDQYASTTTYHLFRNILWACGITHGGRSHGPRLHDLRHTFSVHSLQRFDEAGIPLMSALPLLSVYLGHTNWAATGKYLRLTAECFPSINAKLEAAFGGIIPEGGDFVEAD